MSERSKHEGDIPLPWDGISSTLPACYAYVPNLGRDAGERPQRPPVEIHLSPDSINELIRAISQLSTSKRAEISSRSQALSKSNVEQEELCEKWLMEQMRITTKRRKPKKQIYQEAFREFAGLSWKAFERAWGNAVKKTRSNWNLPGPTKKIATV